MTDEPINPLTEETDALRRIAATHDGVLLHRFLRRMVESVCPRSDFSALPLHEGRRMFAATLMAHMAEGIENSGGRTGSSSSSSSGGDQPILSGPGGGSRVASARDTRRVKLEPGDGFQAYDSAGNPVDPSRAT